MNHLAHVVLAGSDEGLRLGAFLGDHVKGRAALDELPASWAAGVELHRRIDSLSDAHPAVVGLLERLDTPWRRYGGVIFDVLFDYMLSRHWSRFGPDGLEQFGGQIDALLARHRPRLPKRLVRFSLWAKSRGLWWRYGEREMIEEIFSLLARRHGRCWPLAEGARLLDEHEAAIEQAFLALFPDLLAQMSAERERLYSTWPSM
ncbi:acyl carrier protein phosphodiesterase [Wenzhouxiangella sp. EGI_FJ10305]|uniref:acyl carrier protein phosphodiesterase n=1 Tax=Wenzhouxiangella sp. EGI_FJ10305 TaxID=3243768 RepID=UPI0035DC25DD